MAQTNRSGAETRRAARSSNSAADPSARPLSRRDRWLLRQPQQVVVNAARTGEWQGAMLWAVGETLRTVTDNAAVAYHVGLTMFDDGPRMWDWLTNAMMHPQVAWDLAASRVMASAYERTLLMKRRCLREEQQAIAKIVRKIRDVLVIAAFIQAGTHIDQDMFTGALSEIFNRPLDNGSDLHSQMEHSYHQLMHGVPGAFASKCKRGRLRRGRVRQLLAEGWTEGATQGETEGEAEGETDGETDGEENDSAQSDVAESSDSAASGLASLKRMAAQEVKRLWDALEREQAERTRLERETRMLWKQLEDLDAEVARLKAKRHNGEMRGCWWTMGAVAQEFSRHPAAASPPELFHGTPAAHGTGSLTQRLYPATAQAEEWLKQHCESFVDPCQLVEIPVLCLLWEDDYIHSAMTFQHGEPDNVGELVQQLIDGTRKPTSHIDEPLDVVQHKGYFLPVAGDVQRKRKLAALSMYQSLHRNTLVMASCRICTGSSSSAAELDLVGTDLLRVL